MKSKLVEIYEEDIHEIKNAIKRLRPISTAGYDLEIFNLRSIVDRYEKQQQYHNKQGGNKR